MNEPGTASFDMADVQRLQDLVDREALAEVCRTFFELFGLPLRVFARDGSLLADVHQQRAICGYVNGLEQGRRACTQTVSLVRDIAPEGDAEVVHPCFTGAVYRIVPIRYDGRSLGRFVVGPYLPSEIHEVPRSLLRVDPGIHPARAEDDLNEMPRVKRETAERISQHLARVLDLILFSGHKAFLTSRMHLASVRASFRELSENTTKLQDAYDELKELDRLKSNFLATISHELRTPLTSIIGYSEMLASGIAGDLNEEQLSFVDTIRVKGDQLLELITNLLDMARFEQGKIDLHPEPIDTAGLVADIMATTRPAAHKKGVEIESHVEDDLPCIRADAARMRQVLQNLMDNALKFTPSGGCIRLEVRSGELSAGEDADGAGAVLMMARERALVFSVRDSGPGIEETDLERVFDAFYQIDGSVTRQHGGTGLGLSIVKRLVEAHAGRVWAESRPGHGSTFYVALREAQS